MVNKLVCSFVLLAATAAAQEPPLGGSEFIRGQRAVQKRDPNGAIQAFEAALDLNPDLTLSHYYLGYAYAANQNWLEAGDNFAEFLNSASESDPKAEQLVHHATREAGLAYARTSSAARAIPLLDRSLELNPADAEAYFYLGLAFVKTNQPERAVAQFKRALELDDKWTEAHYRLGVVAMTGGDYVGATERLERFLQLDPKSVYVTDAHYLLGTIQAEHATSAADADATRASAKAHLEKFIEKRPQAPQSARAHYLLATIALQEGDGDSAREHLERSLELEPEGEQAEKARALLSTL